jgi:S-adenosylmethionine synthetase
MSLEATAGKNPINHVGKIYNVLAIRLANKIYSDVTGIEEVYVKILSQIGEPIDQPMVADIQLLMKDNTHMNNIDAEIESIVNEQLAEIRSISIDIIQGKTMLF